MTDEEIKALVASAVSEAIAPAISSATDGIMAKVNEANSGLAAGLTRQIKALAEASKAKSSKGDGDDVKGKGKKGEGDPAPSSSETDLQVKALQTQLEDLQAEIEQKTAAEFKNASSAALSTTIADAGAQNISALRTVLFSRYDGKLKQQGGEWFVVEGDRTEPLKAAVSSYLQTDEGKFFVPASSTKGAGSSETKTTPPEIDAAASTSDQLMSAFGAI